MIEPQPSPYRWVILGLLLLPFGARLAMTPSLGILMPDIASKFGIGLAEQGLLVGVGAMANLVLGIPAAWWFSRYRPSVLFLGSSIGATLMVAAMTVAPTFPLLFAAQAGAGVAYLVLGTANVLVGREWFPPREQPFVGGCFVAAAGIVEVIAFNAVPPAFAAFGSYEPVFVGVAGIWLLGTAAWLVFGRSQPGAAVLHASLTAPEAGAFGPILRDRRLWFAALGTIGGNLSWIAYVAFWPTYMLEDAAVPLETSGFVLGIISLAQAPASLTSGWAGSRRPELRAPFLVLCGIVMTATTLGLLLTRDQTALVALAALNGLVWSFLPLLAALPFELGLNQRQLAVGTSFIWSFSSLGLLAGPAMTGFLAERLGSLAPALAVAGVFPLLICLSAVAFIRRPAALTVS